MPVDWLSDVIVKWSGAEPGHANLLREGGVTVVVGAEGANAEACRAAGLPTAAVSTAGVEQIGHAAANTVPVLDSGLWPGVSRGGGGDRDETASASRDPWVDANGFWVECLRALYPQRPALVTAAPPKDKVMPFDSAELALIDARVHGGNAVLQLDERFTKALAKRDDKAAAAWKQFARTAAFLREQRSLLGHPALPVITLLVEAGEETPELANLMFRRNASPAVARADAMPAPDPARRLEIVAANLKPLPAAAMKQLLAHAEAGASVVTTQFKDPKRKPVRSQEDRDFYSVGKGQVIAYREAIADPSEFALDTIDVVTHKRRAIRLWNAPGAPPRNLRDTGRFEGLKWWT